MYKALREIHLLLSWTEIFLDAIWQGSLLPSQGTEQVHSC